MNQILDAAATARALPYIPLSDTVFAILANPSVHVPPRIVQPLAGDASFFVMPATDGRVAMAKLITYTPGNSGTARPAIQGDVVVFDVATGARIAVLDGPTVTARRTAAVSLLAAQALAPRITGPLLIVGAGAQGRAHMEAYAEGLGVREIRIASRTYASANALVTHAKRMGLNALVVDDVDAAMQSCPLVVTCTPAREVVVRARPRDDAFIVAVGAFTPTMAELAPEMCLDIAARGRIVVDTPDAVHEAGDLIQAGIDVASLQVLYDAIASGPDRRGPALFKSCGWAGWDLAAARLVAQRLAAA